MISITDILSLLKDTTFRGNENSKILKLVQIDELKDINELAWCSESNNEKLLSIKKGTVICSTQTSESYFKTGINYILVEDPRMAFKSVIEHFFIEEKITYSISSSSKISKSATISKNVFIGENCIIEEDVVIGKDCFIKHNNIIHKGTIIGNNVKIGSNNTIGGVGFGYVKEKNNSYSFIHHIGNVEISDNVEIGNNNCIDRAVLGSTLISKNVKIDNLVHIAHGVTVGENTLIIANAMIGGSVKIGKNCWIAPSASIINKKVIGDNVTVGLGAVVLKDVPSDDVVVGNPAKSIRNISK
jgi:UDP-3-O-[3-hydroxymyristoyl] glucosamine N-acyltransferase